jgi:hypothetical protein
MRITTLKPEKCVVPRIRQHAGTTPRRARRIKQAAVRGETQIQGSPGHPSATSCHENRGMSTGQCLRGRE